MILTRGLSLVAAGMAAGLLLAWWLARAASSMLYNVSAVDPFAYGGATLFLAVIAGIATALPAWRATRLDPITSLRSE
jgi:ABC-type antimicrobial peptide transport system permease subunit